MLQDSRMDKNLLKKENPKEESKMSDPPKKLFDPAQGITYVKLFF